MALLSRLRPWLRAAVGGTAPPAARWAYVALSGAVCTAVLLGGALATGTCVRSAGSWVVATGVFGVSCTLVASLGVLAGVGRRSRGNLRLALAAGLLGFVFSLYRLHHASFGVHMRGDAAWLAWNAISSGEVPVNGPLLAQAFAVFGASVVVSCVLLGVLAQVLPKGTRETQDRWLGRGLGAGLIVVLGFGDCALDREDVCTARAYEHLPWHGVFGGAPGQLTRGTSGAADERGRDDVLVGQLATLATQREALVSEATAKHKPNILFIVLESFRWDLLDPSITPHLSALRERCLTSERHYSTGTNTDSSMFGLLFGLSSYYHLPSLRREPPPLPMAILGHLGYRRTVFHSVSLDYGGLGTRYFSHEFDRRVKGEGDGSLAAEESMYRRMLEDIGQRKAEDGPFFDLVYTYATHYRYDYPPEFERFKPVAAESAEPRPERAEGLKNRQKNAAVFTDARMHAVLEAVTRGGTDDSTIVVITGDHGEEFYEKGRYGHTWGLNDEIVRVPLLVCAPGIGTAKYAVSSHEDVFPTVFDLMGVSVESSRFMTGRSLLRHDPDRDQIVVGVPSRESAELMAAIDARYKVRFDPRAPLAIQSVHGPDDAPLAAYDEAEVLGLLQRARDGHRLRIAGASVDARDEWLAAADRDALAAEVRAQDRLLRSFASVPTRVWPPGVMSAPLEEEDFVGLDWQVERWAKRSGGEAQRFELEFLPGGRLGRGQEKGWERWQLRDGRLEVLDLRGEVEAVFNYRVKPLLLAGVAVDGRTYRLTAPKPIAETGMPKPFWTAGASPSPVSREHVADQTFSLGLYVATQDAEKAAIPDKVGPVLFRADGTIDAKAISQWTPTWMTWSVEDGVLYVRNGNGRFTARLHLDPETGAFVGFAKPGELCVLWPLRARKLGELADDRRLSEEAARTRALATGELQANVWDVQIELPHGHAAGRGTLEFGSDGRPKTQGMSPRLTRAPTGGEGPLVLSDDDGTYTVELERGASGGFIGVRTDGALVVVTPHVPADPVAKGTP